jgi:transcription termination/antitermination protein NusG
MNFERNWYVVKVISGQEDKVKNHIEADVQYNNLQEHINKIVIPKEKVIQIRNGKKSIRDKALFPGYIMIDAELKGEVPHIIKTAQGVIGFLSETKGGDPVPMRKAEINRMLGKIDELAEAGDVLSIPFIKGETIKVIDGPFNGFNGTIENINEEKRKIEVMVLIFGRKTPLELGFLQVQKV